MFNKLECFSLDKNLQARLIFDAKAMNLLWESGIFLEKSLFKMKFCNFAILKFGINLKKRFAKLDSFKDKKEFVGLNERLKLF